MTTRETTTTTHTRQRNSARWTCDCGQVLARYKRQELHILDKRQPWIIHGPIVATTICPQCNGTRILDLAPQPEAVA